MTAPALELPFDVPNVENRLQQGRRERGLLSRRATEDAAGGGRSAFGGGEATLADAVAGAWEDLAAARAVACPVCAGELAPHVVTAASELVAARCADCGAELDRPARRPARSSERHHRSRGGAPRPHCSAARAAPRPCLRAHSRAAAGEWRVCSP